MSSNEKENEEYNEICCRLISKSITDVIRFSSDESFRQRSFELFGVSSTVDTKTEIYKKLMALIENKNLTGDVEDEIFAEVDPPDQLPSTSGDPEIKNLRNDWLLMSSQQFRECIKSKRTCFYSQQLGQSRKDLFGSSSYSSNCKGLTLFKDDNSYYKKKCKKFN